MDEEPETHQCGNRSCRATFSISDLRERTHPRCPWCGCTYFRKVRSELVNLVKAR